MDLNQDTLCYEQSPLPIGHTSIKNEGLRYLQTLNVEPTLMRATGYSTCQTASGCHPVEQNEGCFFHASRHWLLMIKKARPRSQVFLLVLVLNCAWCLSLWNVAHHHLQTSATQKVRQ